MSTWWDYSAKTLGGVKGRQTGRVFSTRRRGAMSIPDAKVKELASWAFNCSAKTVWLLNAG